MILTENHIILKMKAMGQSNAMIATRLKITEAQVEIIWREMLLVSESYEGSGHMAVMELISTMAVHYQQIGLMLSGLSGIVSELASVEEIKKVVDDQGIEAVPKNFIVLRRYIPPSPEDELKTIQGN